MVAKKSTGSSDPRAASVPTITATPDPRKPGRFVVVAAIGDREFHRDTIDLNSDHSRRRFVEATIRAALAGTDGGTLTRDRDGLNEQLLAFARQPPEAPKPQPAACEPVALDPRQAALEATPGDVREAAEALLDDPKLLERVAADIEALDVVGEAENKVILYLVGTSAQLPRPLAAITRGASSSGKSFVLDRVASLFPPEVALHATSLTTNALYYFTPGDLRHRWVVAGERSRVEDDEQAEATRALREMIEAGRLTKAVTIKEDGRLVTRLIDQPGPIAYAETTTLGHVFAEDANRCLLLSTDEAPAQTARILEASARAAAGRGRPDAGRIRDVHHAVQRMIPRADVVVPFASAVAEHYPTDRLEGRRDFRHLLQLVKASALLHFRQRDRDADGNVVATLDDYAVAERLARGPLGTAATGLSTGARQFLDRLRAKFGDDTFTTTQALDLRGAGRRTLGGRIHELSVAGVLEQTEPPRGRIPAKWRLTDIDPDPGLGIIPTFEQVQAAHEQGRRADTPQAHVW